MEQTKNKESLIQFLDSLENVGIPGCDCVVYQNHEPVFRHMTGFADAKKTKPITSANTYWIYSASKLVTCTAIMQLIEKGFLQLEDPVASYLPEYKDLKVRTNSLSSCAAQTLTIRHLMTMQSGLNYNLEAPSIKRILQVTQGGATTREVIRALAEEPLDFEPGTHYQYSLSHDVLGAVIEVVSGMPLGRYLKVNIFEPLDMKNTGFDITPDQKENLSEQFTFHEDSKTSTLISQENKFKLSNNYESGGAGLVSTVDDYIKFLDALCNGGTSKQGKQILSPESIERMKQDELQGESREDFAKLGKLGYSYGLGVRTLVEPDRYGVKSPIGEFGWDGAAGAYALVDTQNKVAVFYAQHSVDCEYVYREIHPKIRNMIYEIIKTES